MNNKIKSVISRVFVRELQRMRDIDYICFYLFYRVTKKVNDSQILLLSESREELSGNLKFIDEKIDKSRYTVIYSLKKNIMLKRNLREKMELCRELATSKFILVDDFIPIMYPIPLRKETRFIQVWHAMGAFKKVGFSRLGKPGGPAPRSLTHRNYTDAIVSSEQICGNYAEAFGITKDKIHPIGIPRTDVFFDESYRLAMKRKYLEQYPQLKNKKVILFAPTFRGNGIKTAFYNYSWLSFQKICKKLKDDYIFIIKMHPFIKNKVEETLDPSFYLDLSSEREINDLLFITDVLITDYSSVIFEASLLNIHTIFFAPDLDEYISSRDFYYPYSDYTFGPVVDNTEDLIEAICNGEIDMKKISKFRKQFCSSCDGKSTQRFVDLFFNGE